MCLRKKIGPDPRNFNQRVSLGRNDLLIRTFLSKTCLSGLLAVLTTTSPPRYVQCILTGGSRGLEGKSATTHWEDIADLARHVPNTFRERAALGG
jgi:hypothetical protein